MLYQTKNPHGGEVYENPGLLDFSANINPLGTPPAVKKAVEAALPLLSQYPDPYCRELVAAISDYENIPKEQILCGNGAAELIFSLCQALRPEKALLLAPSFSEYESALRSVGCRVERWRLPEEQGFALTEDFLEALDQFDGSLLMLCNPNNPTGQVIERGMMERILSACRRKGIFLFVDECFLDLTEGGEALTLKGALSGRENLLLLKAFTKSYGMAGIRLGYCLCADGSLLKAMAQEVQPWNVSSLAQAAGVAALKESGFLQKTKDLIGVERPWLQRKLEGFGFRVCPSSVNYLLFQGPTNLHAKLKEKGIAIRNCDNYPGLTAGWYRVAVRRHEENEMLIAAIDKILKGA